MSKLIELHNSDDEIYTSLFDTYTSDQITEHNDACECKKDDNIYLIHNEYTSDNPDVSKFISFCVNNGLFDNTFYDTNNILSVLGTKLPTTFDQLSADGQKIERKIFLKKFKKEFGYEGNITKIYENIDKNKKGFIIYEDFIDFFLPFVKYVTI